MNNFAFCTITYGEKYVILGDALIDMVTSLGGHIFVMTNDLNHYDNVNENVTLIEYPKTYFSFHEKKTVMKECLKEYETAIFLDADVIIKNELASLDFLNNIQKGIHIFATFGNIKNTFLNNDVNVCHDLNSRNTKYGPESEKFLNENGYEYKKIYNGVNLDYLEHFLEGKWIIKKDNGLEDKFFEIWDKIAEFCEHMDKELGYLNSIGAGEGAAMSIAAHNSGIQQNVVSNLCSVFNKHFIANYVEKTNGSKPWNIAG